MTVVSLLKNRSFAALVLANTIFGAAFPIQLLLGALAGMVLAPSPALVTLASSVQTLAALVAAAPLSLLMGRFGRRAGFALGAALTLAGALCAIAALYAGQFALLCLGHFLMGAGWSAFQYFRFAAGEVVERRSRPVAISLMLSSLLIAAIAGPQIFKATQDALGPVPFAGAYAAVAALAVLGLLPLAAARIPRPTHSRQVPLIQGLAALRRRPVLQAVTLAAVAQGIMVFLMIPTPIAILACGFNEATAGDVISWHLVAMFAPSFFTGVLIQRFGATAIARTGLALLLAAAALAALGIAAWNFYSALILLGLGWNFGFIGATALLDATVPEAEKAAVQGANDTIIALVSTLCAFAAGPVLSLLGWAGLATVSGAGVVVTALLLGRGPAGPASGARP